MSYPLIGLITTYDGGGGSGGVGGGSGGEKICIEKIRNLESSFITSKFWQWRGN